MTTYFHDSATHSAARSTKVNAVIVWVAAAVRAWKNRRAFYQLGEMSDAQLHDIGLTRADLFVPTDLPFTQDPTAQLARTARQRINRMERLAGKTA